jgi:hypothetical protein
MDLKNYKTSSFDIPPLAKDVFKRLQTVAMQVETNCNVKVSILTNSLGKITGLIDNVNKALLQWQSIFNSYLAEKAPPQRNSMIQNRHLF